MIYNFIAQDGYTFLSILDFKQGTQMLIHLVTTKNCRTQNWKKNKKVIYVSFIQYPEHLNQMELLQYRCVLINCCTYSKCTSSVSARLAPSLQRRQYSLGGGRGRGGSGLALVLVLGSTGLVRPNGTLTVCAGKTTKW